MGEMERAVIRHSVMDVIEVLENNPVQPDMVTQLPVAQLMNRVSIAHLSFERTMKFLITEAGGTFIKNHDLPLRLKELRQSEPESARFLEDAFKDAVQHYRYNSNATPMKHLKSLETYLQATGSDEGFQDIRYWELTQSTDEILIRKVSLNLHLELLHALTELLLPGKSRKDTTSARVERVVQNAVFPSLDLAYTPGTDKELSVNAYIEWLKGFRSFGEAITAAFREGVTDDNFIQEILRKAFQELTNSKDPAVRYFAETLTVLPKQPRDAVPCVEWLGPEKHQTGKVSTPGGHHLGFIFRRSDGLWNIMPSGNGPGTLSAIAETQTDARCYLASILSRPTKVIVNGEERNLRIVGEEYDLFRKNYDQVAEWHEKPEDAQQSTYQVEFWDDQHSITDSDSVKLEARSKNFHNSVDVLEGTVTDVADHKVYVSGIEYFDTDDKYSKPDRG